MEGPRNLTATEANPSQLSNHTTSMEPIRCDERAELSTCGTLGVAVTDVRRGRQLESRRDCGTARLQSSSHRSKPTILVAVDFRPSSLKAVELAFAWAKRLRACLLLLHVVDPIFTGEFVNLVTRQKVRREARRRAWERINKLAEAGSGGEDRVACVVRDGVPEIEILQLAGEMSVSLIVLGRRHRSPLSRWILGSVSDCIIDLAPCPVTLVNSSAAAHALAVSPV